MNKMTHTKINLNNLLMGLSVAFDKAFLPNRYNFLDHSNIINDTTNEIMKLSLLIEENLNIKSNVVINSSQIKDIVKIQILVIQ